MSLVVFVRIVTVLFFWSVVIVTVSAQYAIYNLQLLLLYYYNYKAT
jgi:hypothetical protein